MYFVYILESLRNGKYYIGSTKDVEKRLREHNQGKTKSTKGLMPLEIVYTESYASCSEARKRESEIKRRKSRKYIDSLIEGR
ncbi:MAG: GIY-YIG nuclease family protein [Candidatus Saganbacteria bacterium]|nr:GIY-YIG nuclease family protein [Candidatus Saganbacteria bacterium]